MRVGEVVGFDGAFGGLFPQFCPIGLPEFLLGQFGFGYGDFLLIVEILAFLLVWLFGIAPFFMVSGLHILRLLFIENNCQKMFQSELTQILESVHYSVSPPAHNNNQ